MRLSIIIVTYNSARFMGGCLKSLRVACAGIAAELIVVDNGSVDDTLRAVRAEWPNATLIRNSSNRGFAAANNQGVRVSQGDYLLLLNADTVLLDRNLASALLFAEQNNVAVLGPRMVGPEGALQRTWHRRNSVSSYLSEVLYLASFARHFGRAQAEVPTTPTAVRFLVGAALLVSRAAYLRHGLFDERFFFCCEERDLCFRYASAGEELTYFPEWSVLHYGGGGALASRFHLDNWIKASFLFVDKHGGLRHRLLVRLILPLFVINHGAAFLLKAIAGRNRLYWELARLHGGTVLRLPRFMVAPGT